MNTDRSVRGSLSRLARRRPTEPTPRQLRTPDESDAGPTGRPGSGDPTGGNGCDGRGRRTFEVRELAEADGLAEDDPCDALVRSIVRRAEAGDAIRFRDGRFLLEDLHVIGTALVVEGEDSTLDFGESGGLHFRGSHSNGADPAVTVRTVGSVPRGERTLAVEGTGGFAAGDYVLVETGYAGWSSRHPLRAGSGYACQIARLEEVAAGRLVLDRDAETRFDAAADGGASTIEIHRLEPLETPVFRNLATVGGRVPLRMESCVGGRFERCRTSRYADYGQRVDYCLGSVYEASVVTDPRDDGRREAIHVAHSTGTTIDRLRVRGCRLGIGLSNGCFGVGIDEPSVSDASVHAIGTHEGATAGGIRIEGGTIESERRGESELSFSSACESVSIRGTVVRTTRTPVSADARRLVATDVVIESVDDPDVPSGGRPVAVRFGGGEALVAGVLDDGGGRFSSTSDLRGAERATIDLARARRPAARRGIGLVAAGLGYLSRAAPGSARTRRR